MDTAIVLSFLWFSVLLTLMPGPDIIFVLTESIVSGRKPAIAIATGLVCGVLVHTTLAATGISLIVLNSKTAFYIVKYAGAAYLIYLAVAALKEKPGAVDFNNIKKSSAGFKKLIKTGFFMNVLNPKVSLFFIAFLPQFVTESAFPKPLQMVVLGLIFIAQAWVIFAVIGLGAGTFREFFSKKSFWVYAKYIKFAVYLVIALKLVVTS